MLTRGDVCTEEKFLPWGINAAISERMDLDADR